MRHLSGLVELLQSGSVERRREVTYDFFLNISSENIVSQEDSILMLALLKDPDDVVRLNAIRIFNALAAKKNNRNILSEVESVAACIRLLKNDSDDIKRCAVIACSNFSSSPDFGKMLIDLNALPSLMSFLQNKEDNQIRVIVSQTLNRLMYKLEFKLHLIEREQLPVLIDMLEDEEREVQTYILLALHGLAVDEKTRPFLIDARTISTLQTFCEKSADMLLRRLATEMIDLLPEPENQFFQSEQQTTARDLESIKFLDTIDILQNQEKPYIVSSPDSLRLNSIVLSGTDETKSYALDLMLKLSLVESNQIILVDAGSFDMLMTVFDQKNILINRIATQILKNLLRTYDLHKIFLKEESRVIDLVNLLETDYEGLIGSIIVIFFYFSDSHEALKSLAQEKFILKMQSLKETNDSMVREFVYIIASNCKYNWRKYFTDQQEKDMLQSQSEILFSDYISSNNVLVALQRPYFATGNANRIVIWDFATKRFERILRSDNGVVLKLMLLANNILLSYNSPNLMSFWDWRSGECIRTVSEGRGLEAFTVLSNHRLVTSSEDPYPIKIWARSYKYSVLDFRSFRGAPVSMVGINDEKIACAYPSCNEICVLDTKERKISDKVFSGHIKPVLDMLMLQNGYLASISEDNTIKFWEVDARRCLNTINLTGRSLHRLATMGDYYVVAFSSKFSQNSSIKVWDIRSLSLLKSIEYPSLYMINDAIIVLDFVLLLSLKIQYEEKLTILDFSKSLDCLRADEDDDRILSNSVNLNQVITSFSFFNVDQSLARHYSTISPVFEHRWDISNNASSTEAPTFNL